MKGHASLWTGQGRKTLSNVGISMEVDIVIGDIYSTYQLSCTEYLLLPIDTS